MTLGLPVHLQWNPCFKAILKKSRKVVLKEKWSLVRKRVWQKGWSVIRVVSYHGGLWSGQSYQGGLSVWWSFIRVVFHQSGLLLGGFCIVIVKRPVLPPCAVDGRSRNPLYYYYYFSSGWSLSSGLSIIRYSFMRVVSHQGGLSSGWSLIRVVFPQGGLSSGWSFLRVVSHQGGLSSGWSLIWVVFPQGDLSSGWSFLRVISHQGGLSSGWSLIRVVFPQGGLSSGWSFLRVVSHQGGLSSGWSLIRVVFPQGGLSSGWSFLRVVSHQGGLSSGWSLIRVVFHQNNLSLGFSFISVSFIRLVFHHGIWLAWSLQPGSRYSFIKGSTILVFFPAVQVSGKYVLKSGTDFRNCSKLTFLQNGMGWTVDIERVDLTSDFPEDPELKDVVGKMLGMFLCRLKKIILYNVELAISRPVVCSM